MIEPWLTQRTLADLEAEIRQCENIAWQAVAVASAAEERQRALEVIRDRHIRVSERRAAEELLLAAQHACEDRGALETARWEVSHPSLGTTARRYRVAVDRLERLERLHESRLEDLRIALKLVQPFRQ